MELPAVHLSTTQMRYMKRFKLIIKNVQLIPVATAGNAILSSALLNSKRILLAIILLYAVDATAQQNTDTAYQRVIAERTAKIVNTLGITDAALNKKVQQQIADQYINLNAIHDKTKATVAAIKARPLSKEEISDAVKKEEENKSAQLKQLHTQFIAQLNTSLTQAQVEKIKDGMTYSVLPVTWKAYMEMLLHLTQEQKDKMYAWLVEARELAMDEGSSDAKHAVFGKYKGRINNYLSAEGYDMKKEGEDWAKRIQAAKDAKQSQN
jgi:hypothetical protein